MAADVYFYFNEGKIFKVCETDGWKFLRKDREMLGTEYTIEAFLSGNGCGADEETFNWIIGVLLDEGRIKKCDCHHGYRVVEV